VFQTVLGAAIIAGAIVGSVYAAIKFLRGDQSFGKWQSGGSVTLTGSLALCAFAGSIGAALVHNSGIWLIPGVGAWLVGYVSQNRAHRRHQREEDELRRRNALDHPGIFEGPPPAGLEAMPDERLDLFDCGACSYLGTVSKSDIEALLHALAEMPDRESNDIFVMPESLELAHESRLTDEFTALLNGAFQHRDYLVLRWMPRSGQPSVASVSEPGARLESRCESPKPPPACDR
jgi:hypothetical protein